MQRFFWPHQSFDHYTKTGKALFGTPGVCGWIRSLDFKRFAVSRGDILKAKP